MALDPISGLDPAIGLTGTELVPIVQGGVTKRTTTGAIAGLPLQSVLDAQGQRSFNFYDAAGRLQFTVDATGAVCGYEYNANGQVVEERLHVRVHRHGVLAESGDVHFASAW